MKKRFNENNHKQELNRFKMLLEYSFITQGETSNSDDLILGGLDEAEEDDEQMTPMGDETDSEAGEMPDMETTGEEPMEEPMEEPLPQPEEPMEEPIDTGGEEEVEVDVTSLVKGSEEAKKSADEANQKTEELLNKFSELETLVSNMTTISDRIDNLEKEFVKRNPTPVEKLEMRSLSSYPFNQKLTDYWSDKEGAYDVMGDKKEKEYVLTKSDVDDSYSDASMKSTFSVEENPYEEEDVY
jgi:hypothetical protein